MTAAAVILAAGEGSRFLGPKHKLLADVRGKPVVLHAVEAALEADFDEVVVIEGAVPLSGVLPAEVSVVRNDDWEQGQAVTLQVAVRYAAMASHETIVVGLGDMPGVGSEVWRAIREAEVDEPIVAATFAGHRSPPVRLDGEVWPLLPMTGDEGARTLMRSRPDLVSEVVCEGDGVDIDTVEELQSWN